MPFATALRESLRIRQVNVPVELANGDSLEHVLNRYLLAVEGMADPDMVTSILLLDEGGERLRHGAAPSLPAEYRQAIDGAEIGPRAGSCGTAAYFGRPIYVPDIATDPLWTDYADLALSHGLRACWSTPIKDNDQRVIGTFAIYHRSARFPLSSEVDAIQMITKYVTEAIQWAQESSLIPSVTKGSTKPRLTIVRNGPSGDPEWIDRLLRCTNRLHEHALELKRRATTAEADAISESLEGITNDCRRLIPVIRAQIAVYRLLDLDQG